MKCNFFIFFLRFFVASPDQWKRLDIEEETQKDNAKRSEKIYGEIYGSFPVDDSTVTENGGSRGNFVKTGAESIPSEKEGTHIALNSPKKAPGNVADDKSDQVKSKNSDETEEEGKKETEGKKEKGESRSEGADKGVKESGNGERAKGDGERAKGGSDNGSASGRNKEHRKYIR